MRHLRAWAAGLLAAITLAGMVTAAPAAAWGPPQAPMFQDTFSGTTLSSAWTVYNRQAHVSGGDLWLTGGYQPGAVSRGGWILTHIRDASWRDYSFRVAYNNANRRGYPSDVHMTTLYFRVLFPPSGYGPPAAYVLSVWDPSPTAPDAWTTCPNWTHGIIQLHRMAFEASHYEVARACASNTHNGDNTIRVAILGGRITVEVNGLVMLQWTDPHPLLFGGVGLGQIWETNGRFDNVVVRPVSR